MSIRLQTSLELQRHIRKMVRRCLAEANLRELQGDIKGAVRAELNAYDLDRALAKVEARTYA